MANQILRKNRKAFKESLNDLDEYFDYHIKEIIRVKAKCAECGIEIKEPTRWNVCHILPKSIFGSVRSLKENAIYLCREDHATFDSNYDNARKMKIWRDVVAAYNNFKHLVKERHKILYFFE